MDELYSLPESLEAKAQQLLNALVFGSVLPILRHHHTAETYVLLRGRIDVIFYGDLGAEVLRFVLDPKGGNYGGHIPKNQRHTLEIKESSVIFEVKDGLSCRLNQRICFTYESFREASYHPAARGNANRASQ